VLHLVQDLSEKSFSHGLSFNLKKTQILQKTFLHHVDNGCLSDPVNCDMHMRNVETGRHCTARGTSMNETLNKCLNALLGDSIGIDRADRLLNSFFEAWNHRLQTQRLGAQDCGTVRTEVMALLNRS